MEVVCGEVGMIQQGKQAVLGGRHRKRRGGKSITFDWATLVVSWRAGAGVDDADWTGRKCGEAVGWFIWPSQMR